MRILILVLIALVVIPATVLGQERMATVSGHCYLLDAVDHSGTKIVFFADSPSAQTDSTYTDVNGYYNIGVTEGFYEIRYTHTGYVSRYDSRLFAGTSYVLDDITLLGPALEVSGPVSGEWGTAELYYDVVDDIEVSSGDSLLIHPGVTVLFQEGCRFDVFGVLRAIGTSSDFIRMRSSSSPFVAGFWGPLEVSGELTPGAAATLEYCEVRDMTAVGAAWANLSLYRSAIKNALLTSISAGGGDELRISECVIDSTSGWYQIHATNVGHVLIERSFTGAVSLGNIEIYIGTCEFAEITESNWSDALISYADTTHVLDCQLDSIGQVQIRDGVARISGCVLANVSARYSADDVEIIGNTLSGGVYVSSTVSSATVRMNAITGSATYGIKCDCPEVDITYNNVWNCSDDYEGDALPPGIGVPITVNANGDSCDAYYNISMDPLFVAEDDFHLQAGSPCIDAGDPDPLYYDSDGTIADIGAYPYLQVPPDPPEIEFAVSGTLGTAPYPVQFNSSNVGGPVTSWLWDFGDGGSSALANPTHTYLVSDTTSFTIALTAEGPGGSDTAVHPDLITVLPPEISPHANFAGEPTAGYGPVQFTDLSTGQIEEWAWDFGDSTTSTEKNPHHEYVDTGTYTVSLTVTGAYGSDDETKVDYITILPPETVIAGFEPSATSGVAPLHVWFDNTSTGTVTDYAWDFGDSTTSAAFEPTHTYTDEGTYEVVLVVTGPANSDTASAFISVLSGAPAITSVDDVRDDYGSQVYVRFTRSGHDTDTPRSGESYTVERRDDGEWVAVTSGAAYGQPEYIYLVPTLVDSTESDPGLTEFRVVASMDEGDFLSESAWGYSVDNLTPTPEPKVTSIVDVPDDQGGQAYVRFRRSSYDTGVLAGRPAEMYTIERRDSGVWTGVTSVAAYGQDFYQVLAQTLVDSSGADPGLTEFRVIGAMDEGNFLSDPAWGYSVDNIAPAAPVGLMAEGDGGSVLLSWDANGEPDFSYYAVYRDTVEFSEIGEPIGYTAEPYYEDDNVRVSGMHWYRVTAIDTHENESAPSGSVSSWATGVGEGVAGFRLGNAVPNPFNPITTIAYCVPEHAAGTGVELTVYDVRGRLVRTLVHGLADPGRHSVVWDGRDNSGAAVSSGVYLYRLEAEGYEAVRKAILLK